ncbi:MAG TPA: DUF4432 family protein, partial [Streptosporangiaceae bacterium]|nr:DUF4432 family protein [Streptosporangiaceae bacterium]
CCGPRARSARPRSSPFSCGSPGGSRADPGGREFRLTDTVRNAGFDLTTHMFLYHINVGWPLLEEGTRFEAPIARTLWASDSVAAQGASHLVSGLPSPACSCLLLPAPAFACLRLPSSSRCTRTS